MTEALATKTCTPCRGGIPPLFRNFREALTFVQEIASPIRAVNANDPAVGMKPQPESSTQEVLAGLVERVTFHNVENGFCVLRAKARGHRELVTVIGHAAIISAGEWITATGDWVNDRIPLVRDDPGRWPRLREEARSRLRRKSVRRY
jgi:hypothetical protein